MRYSRDCNEDDSDEDDSLGCCGCILMGLSCLLVVICFPFSLCFTIKIEKSIRLFFIFPCTDEFKKVDMRTIAFDVPPQEECFFQILTKDSVTVSVDAVVYAKVFDAVSSVCNVEDAFSSTKLLAATTLRNILGTKMMSEVLTERDNITEQIQLNDLCHTDVSKRLFILIKKRKYLFRFYHNFPSVNFICLKTCFRHIMELLISYYLLLFFNILLVYMNI
ncbi:hypothetical protein KUTeg_022322 [Tegillarca granosa]|uniref:Band 7 domain-containing protein n=1 Tax=Tegillarca granosa TaxID=220873 RepID=A0ABQ9E5W2_TEGGR|nr:hypothetical protein KUTeg_022322 [Tegillarca granosa]